MALPTADPAEHPESRHNCFADAADRACIMIGEQAAELLAADHDVRPAAFVGTV